MSVCALLKKGLVTNRMTNCSHAPHHGDGVSSRSEGSLQMENAGMDGVDVGSLHSHHLATIGESTNHLSDFLVHKCSSHCCQGSSQELETKQRMDGEALDQVESTQNRNGGTESCLLACANKCTSKAPAKVSILEQID